jgi:hypothetical protein
MSVVKKALFACCVASVALLSRPAAAEVSLGQPGSVLVFPLVDSTDSGNTLITVTNTNTSERICHFPFREGDIKLAYFYVDGDSWLCTDLCEFLTPADTLTVLTNRHNPNMEQGFLIVQARDIETGLPVEFDHLVGIATVVNSDFNFEWSYLPYSFGASFSGRGWYGECQRRLIDDDGCIKFGNPDHEGPGVSYYDPFPDELIIPRFFGEGSPDSRPGLDFSNTLYLLSTMSSYPPPAQTGLNILGWNNNERRFSRTFRFSCWTAVSLGDLTAAVSQDNLSAGGDPEETLGVATGWMKFESQQGPDGEDVGILGVFFEQVRNGGTNFGTGSSLHYTFDGFGSGRGKHVKICCFL